MGHNQVLCIADNDVCMDLMRYKGLCEGLNLKADFLKIPLEADEREEFYLSKLDELKRHTAIFAVSDYYAIELMRFLRRHGIIIPDEISIVGFDGSEKPLVDYDVKLVRAVVYRLQRFLHLRERARRAKRKADHGAYRDSAPSEHLAALRNPARVHAHGLEAMLLRLAAKSRDVRRLGVRPEESVVDILGKVGFHIRIMA